MFQERVIRVTFDGKASNWSIFEDRYCARAKKKGWKDILLGRETVPTKSQIDAGGLTAEETQRVTLNEEALDDLFLAIDVNKSSGRTVHRLIKNAKNSDYPDGSVALAWAKLKKKYNPSTAPDRVALSKKMEAAMMKPYQDPDMFIDYIEEIQNKQEEAGETYTDEQIMTKIIGKLPDNYVDQITSLSKDLEKGGLTIEGIREELRIKYAVLKNRAKKEENESDSEESDDETAEEKAMRAYYQPFKGKCHKCGKMGHKSYQCDEKEANSNERSRKFNGKCHQCGKYGHKKVDCWQNSETNESTAAAQDEEIALHAFDMSELLIQNSEGRADCREINEEDSLFEWSQATEDNEDEEVSGDEAPEDDDGIEKENVSNGTEGQTEPKKKKKMPMDEDEPKTIGIKTDPVKNQGYEKIEKEPMIGDETLSVSKEGC